MDNLVYLYIFAPLFMAIYCFHKKMPEKEMQFIGFWILSAVGYFACDIIIPQFKELSLKARLFGKDINKKGTEAGKINM